MEVCSYLPGTRVIGLSDGVPDNFRLFHTPGIFYSLPFKFRSIPKTPKGRSPHSM